MMSSDSELGKKMIEEMVMEAVIPSLQTISGRTFSDEWEGGAEYVEGSPDFIVGLDGKPFGIEITEIRRAGDAWDYVDEALRLAHKKNASYNRRGLFRFPIALVMYSSQPPLFDIRNQLETAICREDFDTFGFCEIWAADLSDDYYSPGHCLRMADMFGFKPADRFGFRRIGSGRKPFG